MKAVPSGAKQGQRPAGSHSMPRRAEAVGILAGALVTLLLQGRRAGGQQPSGGFSAQPSNGRPNV